MDSATIGLIAGSSVAVFLVLAIIILACVARSVKRRQINLSNTFGYTIDPDMWPVEGVRIKRSRKARTIPRQVPGQDVRVNYREPPCSRRQSSGQGVYINPHSTHLDPRAYPDNRRQSSRQSVYINPHSDPWTTPDIRIHSQRQEAYRSIYSAHNNPRAFSGGRRHSAKQDVNLNPYSTYLDPRQTQSMWLQREHLRPPSHIPSSVLSKVTAKSGTSAGPGDTQELRDYRESNQ